MPYDVSIRDFVYILLDFDTVANTSFLGYLHIRQRFFTRFFIFALSFFGTKHYLSNRIFKNNLHTYIMPINTL